jgi:hypothetical protein
MGQFAFAVFVEPFFIEMLNEMEKDKNDVNVTIAL